MKNIFRIIIILILLSTLWVHTSYAAGPFTKLGRGLTNVFTGWVEIPVTIHKANIRHDYMVGFLYGFPTGLVKTLIRTSVGLYEIITFPLPFPNNYETIVEPEFILGFESPLEEMRE